VAPPAAISVLTLTPNPKFRPHQEEKKKLKGEPVMRRRTQTVEQHSGLQSRKDIRDREEKEEEKRSGRNEKRGYSLQQGENEERRLLSRPACQKIKEGRASISLPKD